jgi:hypothetical protein
VDTVPPAASAIFGSSPAAVQPGGFLTEYEVRNRLMMPRRQLTIEAYDVATGAKRTWIKAIRIDRPVSRPAVPLASAAASAALGVAAAVTGGGRLETESTSRPGLSDAANGPTPLQCDPVNVVGEGTFNSVLFTIEFNIVPVDPAAARLILSHRWQTSYQGDENHYLTRVTKGTVVFNGELLGITSDGAWGFSRESPDLYRDQFFHPIPLGFVRTLPDVSISSDGLTMQYVILDQQPQCIFDPGDSGATSIDITENVNYLSPEELSTGFEIGRAVRDIFGVSRSATRASK